MDRKNEAYGGVGVCFQKNIAFARRRDLEVEILELMWNEKKTSDGHYLLGMAYRAPNFSPDIWDVLECQLEKAIDTGMPIVVGGDLNDDVLIGQNRVQQICVRVCLTIVIDVPTHVSNTSSKCLDVVLSKCCQLITDIRTESPCMSNQSPVIVWKGRTGTTNTSFTGTINNFQRTDWDRVKEDMKNQQWPNLGDDCDINEINEIAVKWMGLVKSIVNKHISSRTIKGNSNDKKWITYEIKSLVKRETTNTVKLGNQEEIMRRSEE